MSTNRAHQRNPNHWVGHRSCSPAHAALVVAPVVSPSQGEVLRSPRRPGGHAARLGCVAAVAVAPWCRWNGPPVDATPVLRLCDGYLDVATFFPSAPNPWPRPRLRSLGLHAHPHPCGSLWMMN